MASKTYTIEGADGVAHSYEVGPLPLSRAWEIYPHALALGAACGSLYDALKGASGNGGRLDPLLVDGQALGGALRGLGGAILEHLPLQTVQNLMVTTSRDGVSLMTLRAFEQAYTDNISELTEAAAVVLWHHFGLSFSRPLERFVLPLLATRPAPAPSTPNTESAPQV